MASPPDGLCVRCRNPLTPDDLDRRNAAHPACWSAYQATLDERRSVATKQVGTHANVYHGGAEPEPLTFRIKGLEGFAVQAVPETDADTLRWLDSLETAA